VDYDAARGGKKAVRDAKSKREGRTFIPVPWVAFDCPAFMALSLPARCLLLELARQYNLRNNGQFVTCDKRLRARGWKGPNVIARAKKQLIQYGFVIETRRGGYPNKASWYAVTWWDLDAHPEYHPDAVSSFRRSAFLTIDLEKMSPISKEGRRGRSSDE